jgi:hypothetical protein
VGWVFFFLNIFHRTQKIFCRSAAEIYESAFTISLFALTPFTVCIKRIICFLWIRTDEPVPGYGLEGGIQILVGTPSYGATNLGARKSFAVRKPARAWSWPFTSVYDWDKVFVKHAYLSACTGDLSFKWNVATVRPLAKMLLTCCLPCGSTCRLCRATFCFYVAKSSHPTDWLVIRMFN